MVRHSTARRKKVLFKLSLSRTAISVVQRGTAYKTCLKLPTLIKGQSKLYFTTWPVENVRGQLLLLSLSEVGQHIFEANINGAVAFYELKMKFEMQNVSF